MRTFQRDYVLNGLYMYMGPNRLFTPFLLGSRPKFTHSRMFRPRAWGHIFPPAPRSSCDLGRTCNLPVPSEA